MGHVKNLSLFPLFLIPAWKILQVNYTDKDKYPPERLKNEA